jgi:hypothetical protein
MTSNAPPEVQRAAQVVQSWLDQQQRARLSQDAPRRDLQADFAARLERAHQVDQSKMPAWKDPRG